MELGKIFEAVVNWAVATVTSPAQIIGLISCVIVILSFQQKSNRNLYIWQIAGSVGFFINFWMLGAYNGALMNLIGISLKLLLCKGDKYKKKWIFILIECLFIAATLFTFFVLDRDNPTRWFSFIVLAAQLVGSYALWSEGGKLRRIQAFIVSPLWLLYNILSNSVGGAICEAFNIVSIIVSFIRYRKTGFEKVTSNN